MSNDKTTLADVRPGGKVRLATVPFDRAHDLLGDAYNAGTHDIGYSQQAMELHDAIISAQRSPATCKEVLQVQPSPGGQGAPFPWENFPAYLIDKCEGDTISEEGLQQALASMAKDERYCLAARQPVGESDACLLPQIATERMLDAGWPCGEMIDRTFDRQGAYADLVAAAPASARQSVERSFQAGVAEWMGQCFLPSLYSNMTERGDRLLEEVLELLQAHGYDSARVTTLVDYVFGRPVGEPAQEVGGVMVTLAGYCWVAGLDMHAAGDAELARINQPEVMAKIRAKQDAKNALHFDTPLPGGAAPALGADLGPGMFYIQDTRQFVGNCPVWWGPNGSGYVTRLDEAGRYTKQEAIKQNRTRDTDVPWPCAEIDAIARHTVDLQHMRPRVERLAELDLSDSPAVQP